MRDNRGWDKRMPRKENGIKRKTREGLLPHADFRAWGESPSHKNVRKSMQKYIPRVVHPHIVDRRGGQLQMEP